MYSRGQCIIACPVDALSEKPHIDRVKEALADENKHVIVAIAPSVRTALGERLKNGLWSRCKRKNLCRFKKVRLSIRCLI